MAKTKNKERIAPLKASKGTAILSNKVLEVPIRSMAVAAPTAAPEDIPRIYGSAKGLRKTP